MVTLHEVVMYFRSRISSQIFEIFLNWFEIEFWNGTEDWTWSGTIWLMTCFVFPVNWSIVITWTLFCGFRRSVPGWLAPQVQVQTHCRILATFRGSWTGITLTPFWTSETFSESWIACLLSAFVRICSGDVFLSLLELVLFGGETFRNSICLFSGRFWVIFGEEEGFGRIGATGFGVPFWFKFCLRLTVSGSKILEVLTLTGRGCLGVNLTLLFVVGSSLFCGLNIKKLALEL